MFEWDEAKSARNRRERGFGFDLAALVLRRPFLAPEDRRKAYGEQRMIATGEYDGRIFVVVYTVRGAVIRIVSARDANRRERNAYRQKILEGLGEQPT